MSNTLGKLFTVTSFGESHGRCVGVVVDGCPAGLMLNDADIQQEVDKRRPTKSAASTSRTEEDRVEILSGVFNGHTTGAPLCLLIWNRDADSSQYEKIKDLMRPGHADYTAYVKYGGFNDFRGGGRFSGRITAGFVMAGAVAQKLLAASGIEILAHTVAIGGINAEPQDVNSIRGAENNELKCADPSASAKMLQAIDQARAEKDSLGGIIEAIAIGVPPGLGGPVFDTLEGDLAKAIFAIPAVKGIEFGAGFEAVSKRGSENNDRFLVDNGIVKTATNNSGGTLGGISNGMPLVLRAGVKPTPSIGKGQQTVNIARMANEELEIRGRHDACIVPRAVPVVKAMMAIVICDHAMRMSLLPEVLK